MRRKALSQARINISTTIMEHRDFFKACRYRRETPSNIVRQYMAKIVEEVAIEKATLKRLSQAEKNQLDLIPRTVVKEKNNG